MVQSQIEFLGNCWGILTFKDNPWTLLTFGRVKYHFLMTFFKSSIKEASVSPHLDLLLDKFLTFLFHLKELRWSCAFLISMASFNPLPYTVVQRDMFPAPFWFCKISFASSYYKKMWIVSSLNYFRIYAGSK